MAAPARLLDFRYNTRKRLRKIAALAYNAGATVTQELPKVGLLSAIIVQFRGTITLSAGGALTDLGPWNLVSRFRVLANIGTANLVDLSGFGAYLVSCLQERAFKPDAAGIGATTPNSDLYAAPVASGANTWVLTWVIPIAANGGTNFESGLINLQAPDIRVTLETQWGQLADPSSNVSTITGNLHVYYKFFEVPDPRQVAMPPLAVVRTVEELQPITAVGDNPYTVPRMGTLMQLLHVARLNGSRNSSSIDEFVLKGNKTDEIVRQERYWKSLETRMEIGIDLPTGCFLHDFFHSEEGASEGDIRDMIDTEQYSTLESIVVVNSGATLGSNNNYLHSIRRIFQLLAG